MFMPERYALGNDIFTPLQAALFTGFVWNWVLWLIEPAFKDLEIKLDNPMFMMGAYFVVNFASIWLLARFAVLTGFGVFSYVWVFALALVANFVQYAVWTYLRKAK
jgi:hypothetical protein